MSPPLALWPGHVGANEGAVVEGRRESTLTDDLAAACYLAAARRDLPAVVLGGGSYDARAQACSTLGASLVLHLHLDVGSPAIYHYGSGPGELAARRLAAALMPVWPLPVRVATPTGYPRARALLSLTRAPAVLLELADLRDGDQVARLLALREAIGEAVVAGGANAATETG